MREHELIEVLRIPGRYEVISRNGWFSARPIPPDELSITKMSHIEYKKRQESSAKRDN